MPLCRFQLHATGSEIVRLGWVDLNHDRVFELADTLGSLLSLDREDRLQRLIELRRSAVATFPLRNVVMRAPVDDQDVWAADATYVGSHDARAEEPAIAELFRRAYDADRPAISFKAPGWRCVGDGQYVGIRADSTWDVPEPELAVIIDAAGEIAGYTIGNDLSSRSIAGENPLYLAQATLFHASCALGPWIMLTEELPDASDLTITMTLKRKKTQVWRDSVSTAMLRRQPDELIRYLYRALPFPHGSVLMTGTGLTTPADFTLESGDTIEIEIQRIGQLTNTAMRLEDPDVGVR